MSVMKTSLTIFPCVLGSDFPIIRVCSGLSFATKRIGPPCCTLFTFVTCCSLQFILSQNYLLPLISVLAENTLLKTAYHFHLLLIGFDTLTYRKDYNRSPILVGHQEPRVHGRVPCAWDPHAHEPNLPRAHGPPRMADWDCIFGPSSSPSTPSLYKPYLGLCLGLAKY